MRPSIAIIGRPNVGKSTLFNRLVEKRKAIVDSKEGITRDRIRGTLEWENRLYDIVDTGGYIPDDVDVFNAAVREQSELAIKEADFILFLVLNEISRYKIYSFYCPRMNISIKNLERSIPLGL